MANKTTGTWPFPGANLPQPGTFHLRGYPADWDGSRSADLAAIATRLVAAGWCVGVGLASTSSREIIQRTGLGWRQPGFTVAQVRDLVSLTALAYSVVTQTDGPAALIIDDYTRPATGPLGGHDDLVASSWTQALRLGDYELIADICGLDYTRYTKLPLPQKKFTVIAGSHFRRADVSVTGLMGGLQMVHAAESIITFDPVTYTDAGYQVHCLARVLKDRSASPLQPTLLKRSTDGPWERARPRQTDLAPASV